MVWFWSFFMGLVDQNRNKEYCQTYFLKWSPSILTERVKKSTSGYTTAVASGDSMKQIKQIFRTSRG